MTGLSETRHVAVDPDVIWRIGESHRRALAPQHNTMRQLLTSVAAKELVTTQ